MEVTDRIDVARQWFRTNQHANLTIGLVPTMGALHEGHVSLVHQAKQKTDKAVVTIFVNPTQFAPTEDLSLYPRTLEQDLQQLRDAGADFVFTPVPATIYPIGFSTFVEPPSVANTLEGQMRPTHFRGVVTVVLKLFNILPANAAFFGRKDYQQLMVIEHLVRDLNLPIEIVGCPIIRDADGLAMSSRNRYLSSEQRLQALGIPEALKAAGRAVAEGELNARRLHEVMQHEMARHGIHEIEYSVVCDRNTLAALEALDRPAIALIAARVGSTRLIDNMNLDPHSVAKALA